MSIGLITIIGLIISGIGLYHKIIYSNVKKEHDDSVEKFKKDFHNAYEKLQKDIKIYQDCNLDQVSAEKQGVEFEGHFIKTDLRYLMQHEKINKKCDFLSFHENYLLLKKPEQMYACDCFLENNKKNLLRDCIDEIISKNPNDYIKFDYAYFEEIHFQNLDIKHHKLSITKTDFRYANFSNSKISFDCEYEDDYGWFDYFFGAPHPALFENSEIYFSCKISKGENNELVFLFPQLTYIKTKKSNFHFKVYCFRWYSYYEKENNHYEGYCKKIINYINQLLESCGRDAEETRFTFDFDSICQHSENDLYNKLKDIEKKYNKANEKLKNKVEFVMGR